MIMEIILPYLIFLFLFFFFFFFVTHEQILSLSGNMLFRQGDGIDYQCLNFETWWERSTLFDMILA